MLPLGMLASVPERAPTVDSHAVLEHWGPVLAGMIADPEELLFLRSQWPELPRRPFCRVGDIYPELTQAAVGVGLCDPRMSPSRGGFPPLSLSTT